MENINHIWGIVWPILASVVTVASVLNAAIPQTNSGPLAIVRKAIAMLAIGVAHAKADHPNDTPSIGEVVKDVIEG